MKNKTIIIAALLAAAPLLAGAWDYHFKPKIDRAIGQLSFTGSMAFLSSTNFVAFGSTSLVKDIEFNTDVVASNGTIKVLADGYYELDLLATWEGPSQDIYYSAFSSNGTTIATGQSREHIKNANDDAHLSAHYIGYFRRNDVIGVLVKSDNEAGGTLYDYVFTVTKY